MSSRISHSSNLYPEHWEILSEEDKVQYRQLQRTLDPLSYRTTKDSLSVKFRVLLTQIQQYTTRHNSDDWKRQRVCGIIWLDDVIAINTRQLSRLIRKCKSSINCGFQSLGYQPISMSSEYLSQLTRAFPFFGTTCSEIKQWTLKAPSTPTNSNESKAVEGIEPLMSWTEPWRSPFERESLLRKDERETMLDVG
jgi:hypothetical protein